MINSELTSCLERLKEERANKAKDQSLSLID